MIKHLLISCSLLFALAMGQYANTFQFGYVFDDSEFIVYNTHLQKGIAAIPYFFTHEYATDETNQRIYRPVLLSSFAVEQSIFGNSPSARHILNGVYFGIVCCLLFLLWYRLLGKEYGLILPFLATVLFAVHPIHVEVVANLKSRDEILMLLFGLLSLHAFCNYCQSTTKSIISTTLNDRSTSLNDHSALLNDRSTSLNDHSALLNDRSTLFNILHIIGASIAFILAYYSKANAVTLLTIYPLIAYYLLSPTHKADDNIPATPFPWARVRIFMVIIVMVFLSAQFGVYLVKKMTPSDVTQAINNLLANPLYQPDITWEERIATTIYLWGRNLYLLLIPYPLVYHTGFNYIALKHLMDITVWLSLSACIAMLIWVIRDLPKRGLIGLGLCWYMFTISIYGQVVQLAPDIAADRFLFAPSAGFCLAVAAALGSLFQVTWNKKQMIVNHLTFISLFLLVCFAYFCRTYSRNEAWKDNFTLFSNDIEHLEQSARPHAYLANEMTNKYKKTREDKTTERLQWQTKAIKHYERAIEIAPFSDELYLAYCRALLKMNKRDTALQMARKIIAQQPHSYKATLAMSDVLFDNEKYPEAIPYLRETLRKNPRRSKSYELLAWSYFRGDQTDSAQMTLDTALSRFPNSAYFWREKGKMFYLKKDTTQAVPYLLKAAALQPKDRETLHMLATSYATLGDTATAKRYAAQFNKGLPTIVNQ